MNPSKFSLADVFTALLALIFGFVCFLGVNFMNISDDKVWKMSHTTGCILIAVVIALLLFSTAFGAKFFKRTSRNFKTCFIMEIVLLLLFGVFAVFFILKTSPFTHYFTVTGQKSEIISKLNKSIMQAENMFTEYEGYAEDRELLYENMLNTIADAKKINPDEYKEFFDISSGVSEASQIETKIFIIHAGLFPTNYSDTVTHNGIKEVAIKWLQDAKNTTNTWKPIGIVKVVNQIEEKSNEWLNTLITLSEVREHGEQAADFEYQLSFDDVRTHFTKLSSPTPFSIFLAFIGYVLMLLSWFASRRSTRFPGLRVIFGLGKSSDNEL